MNNGLRELQKTSPTAQILRSVHRFKLTKKGNTINCFPTRTADSVDEFELHEMLFKADNDQIFGFGFMMPKYIKKFRVPDNSLASRSEQEWEDEIRKLLRQNKLDDDKYTVKVWGYKHYRKTDEGYWKMSAF